MDTSADTASYLDEGAVPVTQVVSAADTVLFLCRTPLQARICLKIIETENIQKADVFYYTQHDSESDRLYYSRLQRVGAHTQYIHLSNDRYGIINYIIAYFLADKRFKTLQYKSIYLASIDAMLFRAFLKIHNDAHVFTFDDGTSNIIRNCAISYHAEDRGRTEIIRRLARMQTRRQIRDKSLRHYSIYKEFENICPPERTVHLDIFPPSPTAIDRTRNMKFFIGQPFEEYLNDGQIRRLQNFLKTQDFDYYIKHPRENRPAQAGIPFLDKKGELAETAIMAASAGAVPHIYAGFSTVLFNIPGENARKFYLHFPDKDDDETREMLDFAQKAGCSIIEL
jgi:beta-galactosamide-alpha-2,3-sialyltransferase